MCVGVPKLPLVTDPLVMVVFWVAPDSDTCTHIQYKENLNPKYLYPAVKWLFTIKPETR